MVIVPGEAPRVIALCRTNSDVEPARAGCYFAHMKMKTGATNGLGKQDRKYLALIHEYLGRIKQMRVEMKRSKAEIERMEVSFRRKMAEIDTILKRV